MTIKEAEEATKLPRSNIRFYEKEGLVVPQRNSSNGYREYSRSDVENIRRIAYLRTLGFSIEMIRELMKGKRSLSKEVKRQAKILDSQIADMESARKLCGAMLKEKEIHFHDLDVERYVTDLEEQWKENPNVLRTDCAGFLYLWGGTVVWSVLLVLSMAAAFFSYSYLPSEIPVQWSGGTVSATAGREAIFAYPAACLVIRFLLRPFLWRWLYTHTVYSDSLTNYITNFLCFAALSVEIFTLLFLGGAVRHFPIVLLTDIIILAVTFLIGRRRMHRTTVNSDCS